MDCSMPGFPVLHYLLKFAQTHVHWVSDDIWSSHPLSLPSTLALNLSPHQSLFQWVICSHQAAKVLELQLQHQSFQWIFRVDENPLYSTGNSTQSSVVIWAGRKSKKEGIHVNIWLINFAVQQRLAQHYKAETSLCQQSSVWSKQWLFQ